MKRIYSATITVELDDVMDDNPLAVLASLALDGIVNGEVRVVELAVRELT